MNTAAKPGPADALRISDADRDRAIAELSEHFQAGRLTADELDDRTGRALQARTAADLAALFTDLPRQHPAPAAPAPAPAGSHLPARVPVVPIAIIAVIVLSGLLTGHPRLIALVPILALIIVRRLAGAGRRQRLTRLRGDVSCRPSQAEHQL
jgi:Domain of unknown function (DUF1707)